jgi:hypothetical protein
MAKTIIFKKQPDIRSDGKEIQPRRCLNCGADISKKSLHTKYCSLTCGETYRYQTNPIGHAGKHDYNLFKL